MICTTREWNFSSTNPNTSLSPEARESPFLYAKLEDYGPDTEIRIYSREPTRPNITSRRKFKKG